MDQRHASLIPECDLCVQSVICNGMWTGSQSSKTQGFSEVRSTIIRRGEEECALAMTRQMFSGGDTVPRSSEGLQCYELWHGLRRSTNKLQRRICQRIFVIQENSLFLDKISFNVTGTALGARLLSVHTKRNVPSQVLLFRSPRSEYHPILCYDCSARGTNT